MPKNAKKYAKMHVHNVSRHVCGRCLTKHIADKGVTWRRVVLTKKRWKTRKIEGSEGKLLEKMWKKVKKKRGGKRVKRVEIGERMGNRKGSGGERRKKKREGKVGPKLHDTANVVGILPAMSRAP